MKCFHCDREGREWNGMTLCDGCINAWMRGYACARADFVELIADLTKGKHREELNKFVEDWDICDPKIVDKI